MPYIRVAPPYSVVVIEDEIGGEVPDSIDDTLVVATHSCIAVRCRAADDGPTDLELSVTHNVISREKPVFQQQIATPTRRVVIRSVLNETLLAIDVPSTKSMVKIWANDSKEPDRIVVVVK